MSQDYVGSDYDDDDAEPCSLTYNSSKLSVNKFEVLNKVIKDLGGLMFANKMLSEGVKMLKMFDKKKRVHKYLDAVSEVIPVALTMHRIYQSVSEYYKSGSESVHQKEWKIMQKILKVNPNQDMESYEFSLGREVIEWIASKPDSKSFKVLGFFDKEFASVSSLLTDKDSTVYILFQHKTNSNMLLKILYTTMLKHIIIKESELVVNRTSSFDMEEVRRDILKEFISNFAIHNNVIYYTNTGLECKQKESITYDINQVNISDLVYEIKNSIELGKKRGVVFCGPAGTGKTSIIHKIENEINEYPFIHVFPNMLQYVQDVESFFNFVRSIKPCIIIFEDFDANENMESKNNKLVGTFLEQIDSIKSENSGLVIIATVNDTSLINSTVINRRGRFDKVFYIGVSKTKEEVYTVMKARYQKEYPNDPLFIPMKEIKRKFFKTILKNKLTQSDICEIIDNVMIMKQSFDYNNLMKSLETLMSTRSAIKKSYKEEN